MAEGGRRNTGNTGNTPRRGNIHIENLHVHLHGNNYPDLNNRNVNNNTLGASGIPDIIGDLYSNEHDDVSNESDDSFYPDINIQEQQESRNDDNSSDTNTINLYSKGAEDGIRDLLPLSGRVNDRFRKEDLLNIDEDTEIWGKEFTCTSDNRNKFRIGVKKLSRNGVQWVCGVIKNCAARDDHSGCLIHYTCQVESVNYRGCRSDYLRPGESDSTPVSRLDDIPTLFKLNVTLHSLNISPADLLVHQRPVNYMEVARPQGREKVCSLTVKWDVDDWRTLMNCTRGDKIYSKLFGDAGEQIIMCAFLCPNGDVNYPEDTLSVHLQMIHLPQDSRATGIEVKWKTTVNGVSAGESTHTYKQGDAWGNKFGSHSDFNTRELNIVLELEFKL